VSKVLVWIPSRPFEAVEPIFATLDWAQGDPEDWSERPKHSFRIHGDYKSTSLSYSRSLAIHTAKKYATDWLIVVDADNSPLTDRSECLSYLNQAAAQGYGAVISPALTKKGSIGAIPPDGQPYPNKAAIPMGLSEISMGTGGFMCFSKSLMRDLKPMDEMDIQGKHGKEKFPNYCHWTEGESEDYSLLRHIGGTTDYKVGIDTRLKTVHLKFFGIPSWSGQQPDAEPPL
jgi:hypothetical protein